MSTPPPTFSELLAPLTPRERRFVLQYLNCLNAAKAARLAGYSERSARSIGSENLTKPDIAAAVAAGIAAQAMGPSEVLARLGAQARGDMGDFVRVDEEEVTLTWSLIAAPIVTDDDGMAEVDVGGLAVTLATQGRVGPTDRILYTATVRRPAVRLDLQAAGEAGLLHLVKKYSLKEDGQVVIELYDAQKALELIARHHGLFVERHEHSGPNGGPVEVAALTPEERAARVAELLQRGQQRAQKGQRGGA